MPKNLRFWRNVTLIGLAHVVVIAGLGALESRAEKSKRAQHRLDEWRRGRGAGAPAKPPAPKPMKVSTPAPEPKPEVKEEPEEDHPLLTSAKSDIQLPKPRQKKPSPKSTSFLGPVRRPRKSHPQTDSKTKPKPTPKPSPKKLVVAKAFTEAVTESECDTGRIERKGRCRSCEEEAS